MFGPASIKLMPRRAMRKSSETGSTMMKTDWTRTSGATLMKSGEATATMELQVQLDHSLRESTVVTVMIRSTEATVGQQGLSSTATQATIPSGLARTMLVLQSTAVKATMNSKLLTSLQSPLAKRTQAHKLIEVERETTSFARPIKPLVALAHLAATETTRSSRETYSQQPAQWALKL